MTLASWVACWSARNVLDLHVDGRLTARAGARVDAHLKACGACRSQFAALRPIKVKAGTLQVPPELANAIFKQFEAGAEPATVPSPTWRLAPAQAAALVYLIVLAAGNSAPGTLSQNLPGRQGIEALP